MKDNLQNIWEESLRNAEEGIMPTCPKCNGIMIDISSFTICGAKCSVCDFSSVEAGIM